MGEHLTNGECWVFGVALVCATIIGLAFILGGRE